MSSPKEKGAALARLFQIVLLLQGRGRVTQADMAAACGCSVRQIGRYVNILRQAEVPLEFDRARQSWSLPADWSPFRLSLSLPEALALLLARQATAGREGMPFTHAAQTAFAKIAALLPERLREQIEHKPEQIAYYAGARRNYGDAPWNALLTAARQGDTLEIFYYSISSDKTTWRRVYPYHIVWLGSFCHLIAYCHNNREVRNFGLDGIYEARKTGESFVLLDGFSLAKHLHGAAGPILGDLIEIAVRFEPSIARWAERRAWEFPHTMTVEPDGGLILRGTVRGLADIRKELLTWGAKVKVLEPASLREEIVAEARALMALYSG